MSDKKLIYIVDDEEDIIELVCINLEKDGLKCKGFVSGDLFFNHLRQKKPDLIILDIMLPDIDGIEICRRLKNDIKYSDIPVIMLSAKGEEIDRVLGLEMGADDYVTKPFSPRELVARVKAVMRRNRASKPTKIINIDNLIEIDLQRYEVYVKNKRIELTNAEFNILVKLTQNRGWVFTREQLLEHLWGDEKVVVDRTIDVHIRHLREKLGSAGKLIKNVRGVGYKLI